MLSAVVFPQVLEKWDTMVVNLNRNNGIVSKSYIHTLFCGWLNGFKEGEKRKENQ